MALLCCFVSGCADDCWTINSIEPNCGVVMVHLEGDYRYNRLPFKSLQDAFMFAEKRHLRVCGVNQ